MLKSIIIVTLSVLNLGPVENAWQEHLGYETRERGVISQELARTWATPAAIGRNYLIMQPASQAEVYLRFVEGPEVDGYAPMTTWGWNATELLVRDPDALAERLRVTVFETIGPPKDLWDAPNAPRAMQVLGPGNEVLYLTRNASFTTKTDVDRVFIMVVGGPSITALSDFYGRQMGLRVDAATPFKIGVLSRAQGLPADTTFPLAIATISDKFLLELDEYPAMIAARPVADGDLPPGTAMVSFETDDLDNIEVLWRAEPRAVAGFPYGGRRAGVTVGPSGEWIELIESSKSGD